MKEQIQISYRQRFIALLLSFLFGEAIFFLFPTTGILIFLSISLCSLFMLFPGIPKYLSILCLFVCLLGGIRTTCTLSDNDYYTQQAWHIIKQNEHDKQITGIITSLPINDNGSYRFTIRPVGYDHTPQIQVQLTSTAVLRIEDLITIKGRLNFPKNNTASTFDYINYLKKDGIFLEGTQSTLLSHTPRTQLSLISQVSEYNQILQAQIRTLWDGNTGALIAGILIGSRESMSQDLKNAFQRTGLSHIVAISGFNITIIILFIFSILGFLPKGLRILIAITFIILFTILVGASSAVVRASIMGILGLIALLFERKTTALLSLLVSAVIMCILNPMTLLYDIGFALSFLAVLGLLYGDVVFQKPLAHVPEMFAIRESLLMTLSAQLFTTPIMLYYFQSFSIIAPIANLCITPWIPLLMLLSFITLILSYIPYLSALVFIIKELSELLTQALIHSTTLFSSLPFASASFPFLQNGWICILIYALLGFYIYHVQKNNDSKKVV